MEHEETVYDALGSHRRVGVKHAASACDNVHRHHCDERPALVKRVQNHFVSASDTVTRRGIVAYRGILVSWSSKENKSMALCQSLVEIIGGNDFESAIWSCINW